MFKPEVPHWPAPPNVRALQTTRSGGVSRAPYASLNLGDHVGDDPAAVVLNRQRLEALLPGPPLWLQQVHGVVVVDGDHALPGAAADAAVTRLPGRVCGVMTADCLPVLLCDRQGSVVAAAHAGWRGLCAGIVENTVKAMGVPGEGLLAWLGPAIGPEAFEVGGEVRTAFIAHHPRAEAAFRPGREGKWLADIYQLARQRLEDCGVMPDTIYGGDRCTVNEAEAFFSYRRDGVTGRMGSFIWLDGV